MLTRRTLCSRKQVLLEERARAMRFALTPEEALLWCVLKAGQLGVAFRRQIPLCGRYIADFFAPQVGLVVEVDGAYHARRRTADARRDRVLRRAGYHVLRLEAELVRCDLPAAVARVRAELCALGR
jgi:very-short-patch-repair endonuclease